MGVLTGIPFGGLASLEANALVPLEASLVASDCVLGDGTIRRRNGYRAATADVIGSGEVQGAWRFRPSLTSARTVVVVGGEVHLVSDPSSETGVGAVTSVDDPFGESANVCGAGLGSYLYLASDEAGVATQRLKSDFSLESLDSLATPSAPGVSQIALSATNFSAGTPTLTNVTLTGSTPAPWKFYQCTVAGGTVVVVMGADMDWSGMNWLFLTIATDTFRGTNDQVAVEVATNAGSWETLATVQDVGDPSNGFACAFLSLASVTAATKAAVRRFRFRALQVGLFGVGQFIAIPQSPGSGTVEYAVTGYNSVTGQESSLSPVARVTYNDGDGANIPKVQMANFYQNVGTILDQGVQSIDADSLWDELVWNKGAGKAYPTVNDFVKIASFAGNVAGDRARLYRNGETGWRLVKEQTSLGIGGSYNITDNLGDKVLANAAYRAGGTPPRASAMCSRASRLIYVYENRVYISSYIATSDDQSLYPQFPALALEEADGWSFDISPAKTEALLWVGSGDALYLLSNEACYVMSDLTPGAANDKVFERGVLGRQGAVWAENRLFFASFDGLYAVANRSEVVELSQPIRRLWREWFAPDAGVVVCYQARCLLVVSGQRYLHFDFVRGVWTQGTLSHEMFGGVGWRDPDSAIQNLWFLGSDGNVFRWQPRGVVGVDLEASSDAGEVIPAWVYGSGNVWSEQKGRVKRLFLEMSGTVQIQILTGDLDVGGSVGVVESEAVEVVFGADLESYRHRVRLMGLGDTVVTRMLWEREAMSGRGT